MTPLVNGPFPERIGVAPMRTGGAVMGVVVRHDTAVVWFTAQSAAGPMRTTTTPS